ncbi:MAG TPA: hypothetical protein PKO38_05770 [Bacillota bacterium]|jgi:hypothetical protein|nr:hypothetical protein [Bacillota bacterium]HOB87178.1 hypothetical protein [Bacillota bacterium]HOP69325.1 hypothetical protein [Bacillota bacterium]HPT34723.1 hypothetical protein [Bacillota bacterium]HQD06186.1 hypothetical protein [Bacillota bacterium]
MRDMLRNDLEHNLLRQQNLREQIQRARRLKDWGTMEVLDLAREDLGCHLYSVLEDDSLTRGMAYLDQEMVQHRKADQEQQLQ